MEETRQPPAGPGQGPGDGDAASRCLTVYGSLAPGGSNHHQLSDLAGRWRAGWVTGNLHDLSGAYAGCQGLRWRHDGPRVRAHLFESPDLPDHWDRLDAFEGAGFRRIRVPFLDDGGDPVAVAYLYELVETPP